jgi:hypothetical protein
VGSPEVLWDGLGEKGTYLVHQKSFRPARRLAEPRCWFVAREGVRTAR